MSIEIRITQAELREISELERELPLKKLRLASMKQNLLVMLQEGVRVEPGRFDAKIVMRIGRAVRWRQVLIERLGQATVDAIKRAFKTTVYHEAKVLEYARMPLFDDDSNQDSDSEG